MNTVKELNAAERIAAMKARTQAIADARKEKADRELEKDAAWQSHIRLLTDQLRQLENIPVVQTFHYQSGRTEEISYPVAINNREQDARFRQVIVVVGKASVPVDCSLISFSVQLDADSRPVILHDGEPVTAEIALDLATAVVEKHFDDEGEAETDPEIPF